MYFETMTLSLNTRCIRWRRRLIALIALGLLATQMSGLIHAANLDAHEGAKPCHICKVLERTGTVPPLTPIASPLLESAEALPTDSVTTFIPAPRGTRPPTRASPR